jgi:hypothetical protein
VALFSNFANLLNVLIEYSWNPISTSAFGLLIKYMKNNLASQRNIVGKGRAFQKIFRSQRFLDHTFEKHCSRR